MTQWWAPTIVRVSGDSTMRGQLIQTTDGGLFCNFPERMFLIANHQIYTDWLYLWWIGYAAGMHGRIYVVLKESLKNIPVIGWGMQFAQFIFLKRKWENDKPNLAAHMQRFNNSDPMWLMIFPEGTNLATCTREKSRKWAEQNKLKDMQHTLLPRSTGLHFMLQELKDTVEFVYDCTIAYEGVPRGEYAQDIFTVGASYFGGRPPKSVNMYWRRFRVANIPLKDPKVFDGWLRARWAEKDKFIEHWYRTGRFPADSGSTKDHTGTTLAGCGYIETEVKPKRWYEFLQVFAPIGLFSLVLYFFYGSLPQDMVKSIQSVKREDVLKYINGIEKGEIKVPETKDIVATAPKHLQNRFDAVKKLAEARGTTPEKVIAQLQTSATGKLDAKPTHKGKPPSVLSVKGPATISTIKGSTGTPQSNSSTVPPAVANSKDVKSNPDANNGSVQSKDLNSSTTFKPFSKAPASTLAAPPSKSKASSQRAKNEKGAQLKSTQPASKSVPQSRISDKVAKKSSVPKKPLQPTKKPSPPTRIPPAPKANPEPSRDKEIRKARKKLEIRQGKEETKRKTRRNVEAGSSHG